MLVSAVLRLPPDHFEDWSDFEDIKGMSRRVAALASPSSVVPVIDFIHRSPCPVYLAYVDDDEVELPKYQPMSIRDWIDSTSDGIVGGFWELQATWTLQFAAPGIAASVLLRIASFLFGEAFELQVHSHCPKSLCERQLPTIEWAEVEPEDHAI